MTTTSSLFATERAAEVSIDDALFDFSYELEPKNFRESPTVGAKFAEFYQVVAEMAKIEILAG